MSQLSFTSIDPAFPTFPKPGPPGDPQGGICWAVLEPIWGKVNVHGSPDDFLHEFAGLDATRQHLLAAWWCRSEVENGGFHQFFTNSTGVLAPEAMVGLRAIGLPGCARIVEKAIGFFGSPYPRERGERERAFDDLDGEERDPFYRLDDDDEFYESCAKESGGFKSAADTYASRVAA